MITRHEDEALEMKSDDTISLFWTGGFDSTALMIRRLKEKKPVQPIYVRHSRDADQMKGRREDQAREEILKLMKPAMRKKLKPLIIWDIDQFQMNMGYAKLFDAYYEYSRGLSMSPQYAAFKTAKVWVDYKPTIEMGVVSHDQLWWLLNGLDKSHAAWYFFKGFMFPLWWEEKINLWKSATKHERVMLKRTFSCEAEAATRTCTERKLPPEQCCVPCKGRLPVMDD